MKSSHFLFLPLLFLSFMSCTPEGKHFESKTAIRQGWLKSDTVSFEVPTDKDNQAYSLFFVLRNNNEYPYSNIYFFTQITSPDGKSVVDTLEYQLAYPDGKWIGSGLGETKQNTLVYKENFMFPDSGMYKINVVQAMRKDTLLGLEDLSLMIQKENNGNSK